MGEMFKIRDFSKGLHIGASEDETPQGALVRSRGIHPISVRSARSRFGGSLLHTLAAHSIFRYKDAWYYGVSTAFYAGSVSIKASLGGDRLSAAKMGPTAGVDDRLFIAGGDELFKVDVSTSVVNASYKWTESGGGTAEYYLTNAAGADPGLAEPDALLVDNEAATAGTVGSLAAGEWVYDDGDTLGYDTIYIRLADGTDPDTQDDDYIKALYVQEWGITPPDDTIIAADGGAGGNLDDGAIYKYRFTYTNSKTGTRSNPTTAPGAVAGEDEYTKLLLHCEGADASTTFTDDSPSAHTVTEVGTAQIDTAQKKFGSASGLFDGNSDYLTIPDSVDWSFGTNPFTIETWVRFAALPTAGNLMMFYCQYVNADNHTYFGIWNVGGTYYLVFAVYSGGVNTIFCYGAWAGVAIDTWYHVALIRGWAGSWNKFAICVAGTAIATLTNSYLVPDLSALAWIGAWQGPTYYLNGWLDEYRISKNIARWTANFTPPLAAYSSASAGTGPALDLDPGSTSIDLSVIPTSTDDQVDQVEIWRTAGGGSAYFLLTRIANGTATYTDNISDDDLLSVELPTDNHKPNAWFDDCFGPHNASMFWITRTQAGEKGRLHYSPIGRAEAVEGYIEVTSDADPLQRIFGWRGYLGVISQAGVYQILGTNPYQAKAVKGVPGTNAPHTVIMTPVGLVYAANDGVRIFDGSTSRLLNFDAVSKIFRGITAGDLTSFNPVVAAYARGEYFISDASQTLALRLEDLRWRDVGAAINAFEYAEDDDILAVAQLTGTDTILDFEKEGTTQDNATNITFTVEPGHVRVSEDKQRMIQNIHVDANPNGETLNASIIIDGLQVLPYDALTGTFTAGNTIIGASSGATAVVAFTALLSSAEGLLGLRSISGTFTDNEIIYEASYGSELLSNTGFETAGGGDPDFFVNWTENAGDGAIADEGSLVQAGSHACKLTCGTNGDTFVYQSVTVASGYTIISFYTRGDGTYQGNYRIIGTVSGTIVDVAVTGVTGTDYEQVTVIIPTVAEDVRLDLFCPATPGGIAYFDTVSHKQITNAVLANGTLNTSLGTVTGSFRDVTTLPVGLLARTAGVKITGSIDAAVEIFGIDIEV